MQITLLQGYPDYIGKRQALCGSGVGPSSYTTGGVSVTFNRYSQYVDILFPALTISGTYYVWPIPSGVGERQTWSLKFVVVATGAEAAAATDLSGESVQIGGYGGTY
jgi:hypothetical protein